MICKTPGSTLISNNVLVNFDTGTGHTLSDSWTFDGVPGTTNYGGMLYLNGLSKKISLGDVDGITGSNRAFLTLDSLVFQGLVDWEFQGLVGLVEQGFQVFLDSVVSVQADSLKLS